MAYAKAWEDSGTRLFVLLPQSVCDDIFAEWGREGVVR